MAYEKNKYLANLKKWNLDLSKYKDGFYYGYLQAPKDIKEFKGFKKLFGFEINLIEGSLDFGVCTSLTSLSNLPEYIGESLDFWKCTSLISISKIPSVVKNSIYTKDCPFFEGMTEKQIRKKYGILKE